jgi:hypothetical protein
MRLSLIVHPLSFQCTASLCLTAGDKEERRRYCKRVQLQGWYLSTGRAQYWIVIELKESPGTDENQDGKGDMMGRMRECRGLKDQRQLRLNLVGERKRLIAVHG